MVSWETLKKFLGLKREHGLRWEILVSLGLLMLGAVTFMGTTALKSAERAIILQKVESLTHVTQVVRSAVTRQWESGGQVVPDLAALMRDLSPSMEILEYSVTDQRGRILAHSRQDLIGRWTKDPIQLRAIETRRFVRPDEIDEASNGKENWLDTLFKPAGSWTFAVPIFINNRFVGSFSAKYPLEGVLLRLRVHRRIVFSIAVIDSLVIIVFGIWLIGRTAIKPILNISRVAQALASGDYNTRVNVKGPREISLLAESFNLMADKIQAALEKQEEHAVALERSNEELLTTQREMIRIEKLASVGHLASGVAHEIGNPLSAILGYTSILQREEKNPESAQYLDYIEKETERIQMIIQGLLEFSRPKETQVEDLDLNELVMASINLVSPQKVFRNVKVIVEVSPDNPIVSGDRHQLQQILINILINAAQAMEGKGGLEVKTQTTIVTAEQEIIPRRRATDFRRRATDPQSEDYVAMRRSSQDIPVLKEGGRVVALTIRDSGRGIPSEIADRIFDPFFTTKGPGEGTGLGLAIAHGIVEVHGGRMWAENPEGGGAMFTILLPMRDRSAPEAEYDKKREGEKSEQKA